MSEKKYQIELLATQLYLLIDVLKLYLKMAEREKELDIEPEKELLKVLEQILD